MNKKTPEPGIYLNVPFSEYLQWDCFSKSMIKPLLKSPAHLQHSLINDEKTLQMIFGSLVDCRLFEPEEFKNVFAIKPDTYISLVKGKEVEKTWSGNSHTCQKWISDAKDSGKIVVSKEDVEKADTIIERIKAHKIAKEWLNGAMYQVSVVWIDDTLGVRCKARYDCYKQGEPIVDLKLTFDASPSSFSRTINSQMYHCQAAMYTDSQQIIEHGVMNLFRFIVAEDSEPFGVATYEIDEQSILTGRGIYKKAMQVYKDCKERGVWPCYSEFMEPINIPFWAMKIDEESIDGI